MCVYIYNGILTIKKNESESVVARWMNIETVIQSEVSQKEKSKHINSVLLHILGFPDSSTGKEPTCNAGDLCSIRVGKIPWRRERLPTPVFWLVEFHGLYSPWGHKESDTTEQLSLSHFTSLHILGFLGGSVGKESSCNAEMQETQVRFLGQIDPLEEGTATHSSILAWRIPWAREAWMGLCPQGQKESDITEATEHTSIYNILKLEKWY